MNIKAVNIEIHHHDEAEIDLDHSGIQIGHGRRSISKAPAIRVIADLQNAIHLKHLEPRLLSRG